MALKERIVHTTIGQAIRGVLLHSNRHNKVVLTDQGPERLDIRFQLYDGIGQLYINRTYTVALEGERGQTLSIALWVRGC